MKFGRNCEIWCNSEIWLNLWNLVKILNFGLNSEIWSKFWNLAKILKFCQNSELWSTFWKVWFGMVGRGYAMNVGRGHVIQNSEWVSHEGRYRAARAAKKRTIFGNTSWDCWLLPKLVNCCQLFSERKYHLWIDSMEMKVWFIPGKAGGELWGRWNISSALRPGKLYWHQTYK